ncbi:flap endonuclease Xni [Moellerella wisconsensis]|uniref:Flap endonuclease Xni n=1 Tax=Moellerella wisconsensis TaxID=158849 RepID=A0A9Q8Q344_9GAMM|nr:flap endonuclease Xni [Moellerella wisconsensis]KLN97657.1 flap endonuclease-like protein [Moellerella wisconsensis]UNH24683.1 flap endonuclease Xni [Moellerella wisconsensis]UNH31286.1 flap endonuclease Xni [Moellerella wisconsensis]WJW82382.1 flap endonuclease Xni [Moellerella wisconsensis]
MIHLLIIDALNLIRRIHAVQGSPCATTCMSAIQQLIAHASPSHIVAVFDEEDRHNSWRHQLLPDYKAGRQAMPEDLQHELIAIKQLFEQQGICCWHSQGDEADDLAATLACKVTSAGHTVTIVSTDKGYCQLLSPAIQIRDYFQKRWLDLPFVTKEFGVAPHQLPDYWGLTGVSSSKIPGVAGIGPKSAIALLQQYETLDNLFANLESVTDKWRKKLENQYAIADICRKISTLRTDLQLNGNLKDLRYNPPTSS